MKILPLNLEEEVPKGAKLSYWPFIDICVIGLFAAVFASRFVMAPGIEIELPQLQEPKISAATRLHVLSVDEVQGEEVIFFREAIYDLEGLEKMARNRATPEEGTSLLVRFDQGVSVQTQSALLEIASRIGYEKIIIAAEQGPRKENSFGGGQ